MTDASAAQNHAFADMADHELIRALQREALDPATREAAMRETRRRRLSLPAPAPALPVAPPSTDPAAKNYAFAQDQFADNPYQSPRSAPPPFTPKSISARVRNALWWLHIALFALMTASGIYNVTVSGRITVFLAGYLALLVLCVVGMVGWRLQKALLYYWIWALLGVGCWLVTALTALVFLVTLLEPSYAGMSRQLAATMGGLMLMLLLPLSWGLSAYAFRNEALWK